jgi:hypothetical protein
MALAFVFRSSRVVRFCVGTVSLAAVAACGGVTITKIPWRGDYSSWSDDKQKEIDSIQGTRYYLPWPSLVVTKEFPVASSTCFVSGTLSADGKYIDLDDAVLKFLNGGGPQAFAARVATESLGGQAAQLQASIGSLGPARSATTGGGGAPSEDGGTKKDDGGGGKDGGAAGDGGGFETDGGGGASSVSSTAGNGTQPIMLSEFLSIEYLPDERQQYAIKTSGTIQDMKLQLTSGWMLESLNSHVDNSAVIKLLEDTIGSVLPTVEKLIPGLQAQVTNLAPTGAPTVVTIKVHTINYAVPSAYRKLRPEDSRALPGAISLTPAVKAGDVVACSPDRELPSYYPIGAMPNGVDFLLQTRGERYLEVATVAKPAVGGAAGDSSDAGGGPSVGVGICPGVAVKQFTAWAKKQTPPIDTNATPPKVLSAVAGGKVVLALQFPKTGMTAAQQKAILDQAKKVKGSDLSSGPCTFPNNQIVVCAYGQAGCTDAAANQPPTGQ